MACRNSSLLCLAIALAICSSIHALDVTKLLGDYPEFASFSKSLTETKLAEQINSRSAVTILALDDAAMAGLSGKSEAAVKAILSTHVLTDFYDERKLMEAQGSRAQVETLYQASGAAKNKDGYIYVSLINEGEIAFTSASAAPNAPFEVLLVRTVTTQPGAVSLLQVSKPIVAPGILSASALEAEKVPLATAGNGGIALPPNAEAPGPAAAAAASRVCMGFLAAASAFASLLMLAF